LLPITRRYERQSFPLSPWERVGVRVRPLSPWERVGASDGTSVAVTAIIERTPSGAVAARRTATMAPNDVPITWTASSPR